LPIAGDEPATDALPKARKAVERALEIDPSLPEAHVVSGWIASWYEHDWKKAEAEFKKALELDPNGSEAHRGYAHLLSNVGRHDEAVAQMQRARELDPLSLIIGALEGQTLFYAGRYGEAAERLNKTFEIDPTFWVAHINLAKIHIEQKRLDAAVAELQKAREFSGGNTEAASLLGYALAKAGRREESLSTLDELKSMVNRRYVPPYNIALVYNGLGETDEAFDWLERGFREHDVRMTLLKIDPKWNNLRNERRFVELMRVMNFE
jgi:tetratricopeptide (TPR) repeat protein